MYVCVNYVRLDTVLCFAPVLLPTLLFFAFDVFRYTMFMLYRGWFFRQD